MKQILANIIDIANNLDNEGYSTEADKLTKIAQSLIHQSDYFPPYNFEKCLECGEDLTEADVIMSHSRGKVIVYRCENMDCPAEFFHCGENEGDLTEGAPSEW